MGNVKFYQQKFSRPPSYYSNVIKFGVQSSNVREGSPPTNCLIMAVNAPKFLIPTFKIKF